MREAIETESLPTEYYHHPVVENRAEDELILPLAFFIDAVPYSQVDSVVGFWVINMITNRRCLLATLRRCMLCRCGCRGWCSLFEMFTFINWSLQAIADRVLPTSRHGGDPWHASDAIRQRLGGTAMKLHAILL